MKAWLERNPALVNEIGPGPSTLLSFCRDVKSIQFYLDCGADPLVRYERSGKYGETTPLRDIAYRRNYACARHLLAHLGWEVDISWASIMGDLAQVLALLAADTESRWCGDGGRVYLGRRFESAAFGGAGRSH